MSSVMFPVLSKSRVLHGVEYPGQETEYSVEITQGKSISIFKKDALCNTFAIGDEAEYDSYNLSYTGEITKITDKQVYVVAYKDTDNQKTTRMDLYTFCWRNYDFDAAKTAAKNADTMQYI